MIYENFMRMVYHCGRNYDRGVDADIYRKMEHAMRQLEHPDTSTKSRDTLENEVRIAMSEVRAM